MTKDEYVAYLKIKIRITTSKKIGGKALFAKFEYHPYHVTIAYKIDTYAVTGDHNWLQARPYLREAFSQSIAEYAKREWGIEKKPIRAAEHKSKKEVADANKDGQQKKSFFKRLLT